MSVGSPDVYLHTVGYVASKTKMYNVWHTIYTESLCIGKHSRVYFAIQKRKKGKPTHWLIVCQKDNLLA